LSQFRPPSCGVRASFLLQSYKSSIAENPGAIICFIIHQFCSDGNPRDGLYHQRQILLRNASSPVSTLLYLLKITWAWKPKVENVLRRQFPAILLAATLTVVFSAASVLSAYVAITGTDDEVLIRSEGVCNYWWAPSFDEAPMASFWSTQRQIFQESAGYVRDCYLTEPSVSEKLPTCKAFVRPRISFNITTGVECPFPGKQLCRNSTEGPIRLESEKINSNTHLGINAEQGDQVDFLQFMICTPVADTPETGYVSEDKSSRITYPSGGNGTIHERYFYYGPGSGNEDPQSNLTAEAISINTNRLQPYFFQANQAFSMNTSGNSFLPLPELQPVNSDLTLVILTNNVRYTSSFQDTLFGTQTYDNVT
jgi:hypothetical protein